MKNKLARVSAVSLTVALVLAGAVSAAGKSKSPYPVTVTSCGHTYTYKQAPKRAVVGWPTTVDTLTALGVGRSVIGYTAAKFGPLPRGVKAKVLSGEYTPSAETILDAKPDFFLANGDSQISGSRGSVSIADLNQAGISAYAMGHDCAGFIGPSSTLTVYQDVKNLGAIFGVPANAVALNRKLRARVAAARALRGKAKAPRVAYISAALGKVFALAGLSYAAQLQAVGADNLFSKLKANFPEISPEKVLSLNADAIVYEYSYGSETPAAARANVLKALGSTPKAKLIGVPGNLAEGPGIAVIAAIEKIAKGLYTK